MPLVLCGCSLIVLTECLQSSAIACLCYLEIQGGDINVWGGISRLT